MIFYPLFLLCIYLNLWWVYNLHKNGVLVTDLTKEYYWQVLGRWNTDDFDMILDNLSISMKKKEFAEEINTKYNTLLYIDLRFKNKVLYKFK